MEKKRRPSFLRIKETKGRVPEDDSKDAEADRAAAAPAATPPGEAGELHTRIVVPRQERGGAVPPELNIELREVRRGATTRGPYLRVVPRERRFMRVAPGRLEATRLASRPATPVGRAFAGVKEFVIGSPFATAQAVHERLSKVKALAIFSSDALSSSAYATEEILLVLLLAGSGALNNALPIAGVIILLLAVVSLSYRQTITAYPGGGGAYQVAQENLGQALALSAAAAIMVGYVLTVSVSVAAGVSAVTSAAPDLHSLRVPMGVAIVALMTLGNLRGVREAGTLFAVPTYFFLASMVMLLGVGFGKVVIGDAPGSVFGSAPPTEQMGAAQGLTLFLILRAFSSGCVGLTGVEAISNGVPAFKAPESRNARVTLTTMAVILAVLLLGVTYLSTRYGLVPAHEETVVSMLGRAVLGENVLYYGYQVATALVLFLAANTSYNAFPVISAILARDRFMPRQFAFRGDRLAYSNGILLLAVTSAGLLVLFGGETTRLIPLYLLGVFVTFTLSQGGMVRRWLGIRSAGRRAGLAINAVGALATAAVTVIIAVTKFTEGAWISIILILLLMLLFTLIRRHYDWFGRAVQVEEADLRAGMPTAVPAERLPVREHVVVPVDGINKVSMAAIGLARELSSMVTAVHLTDDAEAAEMLSQRWQKEVPDVPLMVIESPYRTFVAPMLAYVESLERAEPEMGITVVLPGFVTSHWWERFLHNRDALRLRPLLKGRERVKVIDFPYRLTDGAAVRT